MFNLLELIILFCYVLSEMLIVIVIGDVVFCYEDVK